jgi:pimeloyl-ACP methyl ester carboxylesterase
MMDIVLIPGALSTSEFWCHQKDALQNVAKIHYAADYRGQTISAMAISLVPKLPEKFVLIGFSLGGYIALELITHIPERINKLILINSAAKGLSEKGVIERERSINLIHQGKFDFLINLIFKNSIHDKRKHPRLIPLLQSMAHEIGAEHYFEQLTAMVNKPDHSNILQAIQCPTLLLASRADKVMPPERSEHMANHIKNAKLIHIENCGHIAPLEQPDIINQTILNWL